MIDINLWESNIEGNWELSPDSLQVSNDKAYNYIVSDVDYTNYTFTLNTNVLTSTGMVGVIFDFIDSTNYKAILYRDVSQSKFFNLDVLDSISLISVVNGVYKLEKSSNTMPYLRNGYNFEIKLENVFEDVNFYINNVIALSFKKDFVESGKVGLLSYVQPVTFYNVNFEKSITNKIESKYTLYAVGSSDFVTEINVVQSSFSDTLLSIDVRAIGKSEKNTDINIMYRGISDVYTEIQPVGFDDKFTEIEIAPHNRMWALYEVQQPPIVLDVNNPTMDSYNRSEGVHATINSGGSISMVAGKQNGEIWDSYLRFDTSHLNDSLYILGTKLRLHYTGSLPQLKLEVYEILEEWGEYSVTYLNAPVKNRLISTEYTRSDVAKFIEIDVSSIVSEWISNPDKNYGFYIKLAEDSIDGQAIFRTRESFSPPELIVSHYSTEVYSQGRSELITLINIMRAGESNHDTEIEVGSTFNFSRIDTEIYARRKDESVSDDLDVEITSNKVYIDTCVIVSPIVESDMLTELSVLSGINVNLCDVEICVSRSCEYVEIYSSHLDDKDTLIYISTPTTDVEIEVPDWIYDYSDINSEIEINQYLNLVEVQPAWRDVSDLYLEITPRPLGDNDVLIEITSNKPLVCLEIHIKDRSDIYSEIYVSQNLIPLEIDISAPFVFVEITTPELSETLLEITVSKNTVEVEITPSYRGFSDVELEIDINLDRHNDIITEITVSNYIVDVEITPRVQRKVDIYSELTISKPYVFVEIRTPEQSNIEVEIQALPQSSIPSQIIVSNDRVYVDITPRVIGKNETESEIYVKWIDFVEVEIDSRSTSKLEVELEVISISKVYVEITASNEKMLTEITSRALGENEIMVSLEPRISLVTNLDTVITVGGRKGAYGFVMG